jgi:hypothetical protein
MSDNFGDFDCPAWLAILTRRLNSAGVDVCNVFRGSSIVALSLPDQEATDAWNQAVDGTLDIPRLISIQDPATGATVTLPTGVSIGIIIGIIVGAILLILAIVLLIVWCRKRQQRRKSAHFHNSPASFVPLESQSSQSYVPPKSTAMFKYRLLHDVVDQGESILPLPRDTEVWVDEGDVTDAEWTWATYNSKGGYVPTAFLLRL